MSTVSTKPKTVNSRSATTRTNTSIAKTRTRAAEPASSLNRKARGSKVLQDLVVYSILFVVTAAIAGAVNLLVGQVMLEKSRRDSIGVQARISQARHAELLLQRRTDEIFSVERVELFAKANGLENPMKQSKPSLPKKPEKPIRVASR